MYSRGFAVASMLAVASIAQAGATIQFVIDPPPGPNDCLVQNTQYTVDVQLVQDAGGSDQRLRMVELDLQQTSIFFNISLPTTHDRGTPGTNDDIRFWRFDSLTSCGNTPSFCGFNHFIDDDIPAGAVDTRTNVLSAAFFGLSVDNSSQVLLPGGASPAPVTIGRLLLTPTSTGPATLNVVNAADADANRRARIDFGFDPHAVWRAGNASPNNVSGGTRTFNVVDTTCVDPGNDATFTSSVPIHTPVGIQVAPSQGSLWRTTRNTLRLTFNLDGGPAIVAPTAGQVLIQQLLDGAGNFGPDVSANFTFLVEGGNVLRVRDNASNMPHRTWFAIRNTGGWSGVAPFEIHFPVQQGDASGDGRTLFTDLSFINTQIPTSPTPTDNNRRDINGDSAILFTDMSAANSRVPSDVIPKPTGH